MVYCLYDKPTQTCFLIGSYDLLEKRHEDDVTIKNILPFLSYKKKFYVTCTFVMFTGTIWQIHGLAFSGTCCRDHLEFFQ